MNLLPFAILTAIYAFLDLLNSYGHYEKGNLEKSTAAQKSFLFSSLLSALLFSLMR